MSRGVRLRSRTVGLVGVAAIGVSLIVGAMLHIDVARGHDPKDVDKDHAHGEKDGHGDGHLHAPVPPEYKTAHIPSSAWTDAPLIARGKAIYAERCAVCHGDSGDGKGPAGVALPLKPPDLREERMINEMTGNYWFWRVSEGGAVEPFKSAGSTMPAWKDVLSVEDRWAVIVYQHTFSNHDGPHVTSEHPEMVAPAHATRSTGGPHPAPPVQGAGPQHGSGHKH